MSERVHDNERQSRPRCAGAIPCPSRSPSQHRLGTRLSTRPSTRSSTPSQPPHTAPVVNRVPNKPSFCMPHRKIVSAASQKTDTRDPYSPQSPADLQLPKVACRPRLFIAVRRRLRNNASGLSLTTKGKPMTKKLAALIGGALLVAGCAHPVSVDDLNAVRATAEAAQSAANQAQSVANEARQIAQTAQTTANNAQRAAQEAQACCDSTNQRLDRMFEESQAK